jgi:hypothetical protein
MPADDARGLQPPAGTSHDSVSAAGAGSRRRWVILAVVWIAVLALSGTAAFAYGFINGPGPGPVIPSADQQAVLDEFGSPPAFVVADGPLGPGEQSSRMEQWLYSDAGIRLFFVNGRKYPDDYFTPESEFAKHACSPTDFNRSMRVRDVEQLLGETGVPVPGVETAFKSHDAFAYRKNRVLVGYLDGWFYSVQTY